LAVEFAVASLAECDAVVWVVGIVTPDDDGIYRFQVMDAGCGSAAGAGVLVAVEDCGAASLPPLAVVDLAARLMVAAWVVVEAVLWAASTVGDCSAARV